MEAHLTPLSKRALDVVVAVVVLLVALPFMLLIAAAIKLDSPGPVLFRQTRLGHGGRPFTILKFRTMQHDADPGEHERFVEQLMSGEQDAATTFFKLRADARVTRIGRILRATSVDELPQLINVLRGEMSLVGPRPDVPYAAERYDARHWERFSVLPGITGLWQVSGRGGLSPLDMLELDIEYTRVRSFSLDTAILLRTIPAVLRRDGAA